MVLGCPFFKVLDVTVWNGSLQQVGKSLHIVILGFGRVLLWLVLPLVRFPVFQIKNLGRDVCRHNDLFLCILDSFFFKPLFSIHHDLFQFDGLFYGYSAGLAALEQLILHNVVRDVLSLF